MISKHILFCCFIGFFALTTSSGIGLAEEQCKDPRKIVGGIDTTIEEHQWQVALDFPATSGLCGGSLIQDQWVLTAAHCFPSFTSPEAVRVKAGATNFKIDGAWTEVEAIFVHENYNKNTQENDLALLKLKSATVGEFIPLIQPDQTLTACDELEVTGWGRTAEGGQISDKLQKGEILYVENDTCNTKDAYGGNVKSGMMCAGYREGGIDACQGDSGGPLILNSEDGPVLVGVVSWGEGCARKLKYGVYTRVSEYSDWIRETILANQN